MNAIEVRLALDRGDFALAVEFFAPERGVTAVFGPSGAGKTTLLRAIAGLEPTARGRIAVGGEVWQDDAQRLLVPPHRRQVGFVFQQPALFAHLSVRGNLDYGWRRTPVEQQRLQLSDVVSWLGLQPFLERAPSSLSGGEARRVAIARALLRSPRLLLLDEPLAGLDAQAQAEIFPYFERLHRELELPMFYVSHSSAEVLRLADHVVLLQSGRLRAAGPLLELATRLDLVPWAGQNEPAAVVEVEVVEHDARFTMTRLEFSGGRLEVPRLAAEIGSRRRVRIAATDVSLALQPPFQSSILNVVAARVVALNEGPSPLVQLRVGEVLMLAQISNKSRQLLDIRPGLELYALVKSVAILD